MPIKLGAVEILGQSRYMFWRMTLPNGSVFIWVPPSLFLFLTVCRTGYHIAGSSPFWVIAVTARMPVRDSN